MSKTIVTTDEKNAHEGTGAGRIAWRPFLKLGVYGYTICRARGKGACGVRGDEEPAAMNGFRWGDTECAVPDKATCHVNEELERVAGMMGELAAEGGAMSAVEIYGFVKRLALHPGTVP